jgi:monoamine oxidase
MKRRIFVKKTVIYSIGLMVPSVLMNCKKDPKIEPDSNNKKILVLGAGIAGLAAASSLKKEGFDVQVLEASLRYGGRINSIDFEGYIADLGASWIHGIIGNPLYSLANENAIITKQTYYNPSYIFDIDGSFITENEWNTIEPYLNQLSDIALQNQELSLQGILEIIAPQLDLSERLIRLFYGAVRSEIEIPYAIDAADISARALLIDDSFAGTDVIFPNGMHQLTDVLAQDIEIIYNTFVTKIDYSNTDKIYVYTKNYTHVPSDRACNACHNNSNAVNLSQDKIFEVDIIVIALPLEMLKNENIIFFPKLSNDKIVALQSLQMGTMNKIFLKFPETFWQEDAYFLELLKSNYSNVIEFFSPSPTGEENILVAVLSGFHAKTIELMSEDDVRELVMNDLKKMFGNDIPQPIAIYRTSWHTNALSLGCYPHLIPGANLSVCDTIARQIDNRMFFAGDATSKKYMATAHGAYISGITAAQKIIETQTS